ncbi:MAG: heparinase II/III family protein [Armatimonadota bacterium]|nr:heparinase II/III family protein [Armatimonadota bacterium]MDW8026616.1 heparinase II/III family protein [Armatimonadota bacterium]
MQWLFRCTLILLLMQWLCTEFALGEVKIVRLPQHPRLLFNRDGIAQLKERINSYDWAKIQWEALKRRVDSVLKEGVSIPPRGGNWWHYYACPKHGAPLRTGKQIGEWQWEHVCPVDNEVLQSDPTKPQRDYDGVVIMGIHGRCASIVRDLGIAYQVTGDRKYAYKAKEILLTYAERYLNYPLHTILGEPKIGGGRVGPQTLDESTWLIPMAQGADLIWETLNESERQTLSQKLFLPAAKEVILPHRMGVHNIQCWKNSAVGLVGFLLGDEQLIREAIDNPERGYWTQMRKGVSPDGVWWEGAWGYHFYTLSALWHLTEAARNCGIDLYGEELKRMFDAPLKFMMPNWRLPAFNDSTEVALLAEIGFARFGLTQPIYELAYARYRDPIYAALLSRSERRSDFSLWFGVGELPKPQLLQWNSANYPLSGYAILAKGEGEQATWLCLKYGPHGGGHGHPDKLNFVLYSRGQILVLDPGITRYGVPIHSGWYKTTLAHNTLVVDEANQKPAEGKCLAFGAEKGIDFVVADAGNIYDGVRFVRAIALLNQDSIVLIDHIRCEKERLLDIALHLRGQWAKPVAADAWTPPNKDGYRYLRDAAIRRVDGIFEVGINLGKDWQILAKFIAGEPFELITALGIGPGGTEDRVPMLIARQKAQVAALACGLSLNGKAIELMFLPVKDGNGKITKDAVALRLKLHDGFVGTFVLNPNRIPIQVTMPEGTIWQINEVFAVKAVK